MAADSPAGTDYSGPIVTAIIGAISVIIVALIPVIGNLVRRPSPTAPPTGSGPATGERMLKLEERLGTLGERQTAAAGVHRTDVESLRGSARDHREWVDEQLRRIREDIGRVDDKVQHHLWGDHGQPRT